VKPQRHQCRLAVHPTVSEELVTLREKALSRRQEAAE
jgi:hypothetical protein